METHFHPWRPGSFGTARIDSSMKVKIAKKLDFQEIQEHKGDCRQSEQTEDDERAYRLHQDSKGGKEADDHKIGGGGQDQPMAGERGPKMTALANQVDRGLAGKDEHDKDQRLQARQIEMKPIASQEENGKG